MRKLSNKLSTLGCIAVASILFSCQHNDDNSTPLNVTGDSTPQNVIDAFDHLEVQHFTSEDIIGVNGLTPSQLEAYLNSEFGRTNSYAIANLTPNAQLAKFTMDLVNSMLYYTIDTNFPNVTAVQHNGLAYAWNHKNITFSSPDPTAACQQSLAGLDCSGFLFLGASDAHLDIANGNAVAQMDKDNWVRWLQNSAYKKLDVEFTPITSWNGSDWENGDIIFFNGGAHVGVIMKRADNQISIINSQGKQSDDCIAATGERKGPRAMGNDDHRNWPFFTGIVSGRLRVKIKDSYSLAMRCQGNTGSLYTQNVSIRTDIDNGFTEKIVFIDYDGSQNKQTLIYSYNKTTKTFSFRSEMTDSGVPGGKRIDIFTITTAQLEQPITSVPQFSGGMIGCDAEFILKQGFEYNALRSSNSQTATMTMPMGG
jgi:hypothetical protein